MGRRPKKTTKAKSLTHPPSIPTTITVGRTLRFRAASAGTYTVTWKDLGDLLCVAATTTSAYQLASNIRLRRVEIWAPMASDLVPVTTSVEYLVSGGVVAGNSVIHSDTSMGSNSPAHVRAKPPRYTLEGFQQIASNTDVSFRLVVPVNAIIDISFTLTLRDDGSGAAVTGAVAGATVGALYCRALTSTSSTTALPPVSLATI